MADGEFTVKLDPDTTRRLKDAAEDVRIAEEYDRTGVSYSVEEAMARFDAAMKVQLAKRR